MVGIVIVSHSAKAAEGIRELAMQMASPGPTLSGSRQLSRRRTGVRVSCFSLIWDPPS